MKLSRREMLQTLATMSAGFSYWNTAIAADATVAPRRVVFVYTPEGLWNGDRWAQDWVSYKSQKSFTPVGMAAPLARHAGDLVMFENLSSLFDNSQPMVGGAGGSGIETHEDGKPMILSNQDMVNFVYGSGKPQGQTLDMFLATAIGKKLTPAFPSLQLGVATANDASNTMTYLANGTPVLSQNDPVKVYKSLFSGMTMNTVLTRRQSVLTQVNRDLARFVARLSPALQTRTASEADAITALQQRLATSMSACANPAMPSTSGLNLSDGHNAIAQSNAMNQLITAAFTCDLTRVVTLVFQGVYSSVHGGLMGGTDDDIHSMSHYSTPDAQNAAKKQMFEQIAKLADALKAIPEGAGTMLDNTLIIHVTETNADHGLNRLPYVTIGGRNLGVQVGNYLKLPSIATSGNGAVSGYPTGNFLRSVIKAMGLPDQSFGNPKFSTQVIPGFVV